MPLTEAVRKLYDSIPESRTNSNFSWGPGNKLGAQALGFFFSRPAAEQQRVRSLFAALGDEEFGKTLVCRYLCMRDLLFLVSDVLSAERVKDGDLNLITEESHRVLADAFVVKDPAKSIAEQSKVKNRLILCPRGTLKTTFDVADVVQWILCFPNIRVLFECAEKGLALGFVKEVTDIFKRPDAEASEDVSLFQQLFPDYSIPALDSYTNHFDCPLRTRKGREWTVMAGSLEASMSGWHYDVLCVDDSVTNENSHTLDALTKTRKNFWINKKMLVSWGYLNLIGTRYHVDDLYGDFVRKAPDGTYDLVHRTAWTILTHAKNTSIADLAETDVILHYPQMLPFAFLKTEALQDWQAFNSQYMNDPIAAMDVTFSEELIRSHTIPYDQMPKEGRLIIAWDLAFSTKIGRDYSCAAIGMIDKDGRLFIVDLVHGRFNPTALGMEVALCFQKYSPYILEMEDTGAATWLDKYVQEAMARYGTQGRISWVPPLREKNAKDIRIKYLHVLLTQGRLWFSASISKYDELINQFIRYTGDQGGHDDIPDAISMLHKHLPQMVLQGQKNIATNELVVKTFRDKALHEMIFGLREAAEMPAPAPEMPPPDYQSEQYGGLHCDLGFGLVG